MTDQLTTCPKCKSEDACYITPINEFHNVYACFGCGFTTSDLMREEEFDFEADESKLIELLGTYCLAWLDGVEINDEVKEKMQETLLPYNKEITKNNTI